MEKTAEFDNRTENEVSALKKTSYYFGCGPFHPKCLQYVFARKTFFTFLLCALSFMQFGIMSGCLSSVISTLQKRYNFSSLLASIIPIVFDVTVLICVIFIAYFGNKTHPPQLLGCSALLVSFGATLFAMPQFFFGHYQVGTTGIFLEEECQDSRISIQTCDNANTGAYIIFVLSSALIGVGSTPIHTVGVAYIDEIVYPKYVALHIGVYGLNLILGGIVGYGIGSAFLSTYVDPWYSTILTPQDPAWVGAWWIPFLIIGALLFLLSIPFFMFPRFLPDSHLVREERSKEMAKVYSSKYANENSLSVMVKMFPIHIKRLLFNPSFVFMVLGYSTISMLLQGVITFSPKYFEVQFDLTASTAGIIVGAISAPGAILGSLLGALIVFGCKSKGKTNALIVIVITIIITPLSLFFLLHCPQLNVVGIPRESDSTTQYSLTDTCYSMCNCTSDILEPVCGSDGINYFSGCRAGCDKVISIHDNSLSFENCTCIRDSLYNSNDTSLLYNGTATDGYCDNSCLEMFIPAILGTAFLSFLALLAQIPFLHFILRVVAEDQRALALAVQSAMTRILGDIPGPLIIGALFDVSCISWQYQCDRRGNCWLYDKDKLSYVVIGIGIPCCCIAILCYIISWITYPKKDNENNTEKDIELK